MVAHTLIPEDELAAGQMELIRGVWLAEMPAVLSVHSELSTAQFESPFLLNNLVVDLIILWQTYRCPNCFVFAVIQDGYQNATGLSSNVVVYQPYIDHAYIVDDGHGVLLMLSLLSLLHAKRENLIMGLKCMRTCFMSYPIVSESNNLIPAYTRGDAEVFASITHSYVDLCCHYSI
jgi:hypothetical protein